MPKKILIIDDDPDICDSITAILTANGFEAITALSGKEGIDAAVSAKPDLILCDMMMESIDAGSRVAQEIKKNNPSLPIYLLSSIGQATATTIEIDKLGFNGVFQKPVNLDHLLSTIRKALSIG